MFKPLIKGASVVAVLLSAPAWSASYDAGSLGYLEDYTFGPKMFVGSFTDVFDYELTENVDTVNFATIVAGNLPSLSMELYGPGLSNPLTWNVAGTSSVSLDETLAAGNYKVTVSGSVMAGTVGTYVFGVATAVPEAEVSTLFSLGTLATIGGVAFQRRRKQP
jgi:hypothetical protein